MPQAAAPNPLDQLKAIHIPQDVSMWPLAWGWWILLMIVFLLIIGGLWLWSRRRNFLRAKQHALILIEQTDVNSPDAVSALNRILKRVAREYDSSTSTSALYGEAWVNYLLSRLPETRQQATEGAFKEMHFLLYQPHRANAPQSEKIKQAAAEWIRHANIYSRSLRRSVRESHTHV